jgi:hypothetical protein
MQEIIELLNVSEMGTALKGNLPLEDNFVGPENRAEAKVNVLYWPIRFWK